MSVTEARMSAIECMRPGMSIQGRLSAQLNAAPYYARTRADESIPRRHAGIVAGGRPAIHRASRRAWLALFGVRLPRGTARAGGVALLRMLRRFISMPRDGDLVRSGEVES